MWSLGQQGPMIALIGLAGLLICAYVGIKIGNRREKKKKRSSLSASSRTATWPRPRLAEKEKV